MCHVYVLILCSDKRRQFLPVVLFSNHLFVSFKGSWFLWGDLLDVKARPVIMKCIGDSALKLSDFTIDFLFLVGRNSGAWFQEKGGSEEAWKIYGTCGRREGLEQGSEKKLETIFF